jgi:hypothetical protein
MTPTVRALLVVLLLTLVLAWAGWMIITQRAKAALREAERVRRRGRP